QAVRPLQDGAGAAASCSLAALERQVLGARRRADVAGFEIPARYFRFVRSGDARPLAAILEHNRLDLLSLAGLTCRLLHLAQAGADAADDGWEAVALGWMYWRSGLESRAQDAYLRALAMVDGSGRGASIAGSAASIADGVASIAGSAASIAAIK